MLETESCPRHSLTTFPHIFHNLLPMKQQGTVEFSQHASPNLGSLRPIVAQRTSRYDVVNKCVVLIVDLFISTKFL